MAAFASSAGTQQKPGVRGVPAVMGKTVSPYVRFEVRASQKANRDLSAKRQLTRRKGRDIRDVRNLAFLRRGRFPAFVTTPSFWKSAIRNIFQENGLTEAALCPICCL